MLVQKIQNNNYSNNTKFTAHLVDSGALRRFEYSLTNAEREVFDSYIRVIEGAKDNTNYIFDIMHIMRPKSVRKIAVISVQNKDKTIQNPPILAEKAENTMNLFKRLAEHYTEAHE